MYTLIRARGNIAGIYNTGGSGNYAYATSAGQLFTLASARRYKRDIRDLGDTTDEVMGLRPVRQLLATLAVPCRGLSSSTFQSTHPLPRTPCRWQPARDVICS